MGRRRGVLKRTDNTEAALEPLLSQIQLPRAAVATAEQARLGVCSLIERASQVLGQNAEMGMECTWAQVAQGRRARGTTFDQQVAGSPVRVLQYQVIEGVQENEDSWHLADAGLRHAMAPTLEKFDEARLQQLSRACSVKRSVKVAARLTTIWPVAHPAVLGWRCRRVGWGLQAPGAGACKRQGGQ